MGWEQDRTCSGTCVNARSRCSAGGGAASPAEGGYFRPPAGRPQRGLSGGGAAGSLLSLWSCAHREGSYGQGQRLGASLGSLGRGPFLQLAVSAGRPQPGPAGAIKGRSPGAAQPAGLARPLLEEAGSAGSSPPRGSRKLGRRGGGGLPRNPDPPLRAPDLGSPCLQSGSPGWEGHSSPLTVHPRPWVAGLPGGR